MATAAAQTNNKLFARFSQTPALVEPDRQDEFEACVRGLVTHESGAAMLADTMGAADDDFWPPEGDWRAMWRPYNVDANGILRIPVQGVLLNKFGYQVGSWATGYQYIQKAIERGLEDPVVKGIAFIIDSPGGEVAGNFELVDKIYGWRGEKPMRAFAYDYAYSAAYSIASAADAISMTRTGGVGSIGVLTMHVDYSAALEKAGVKITYIFAGKHKVDGNPYEKLPDNVKARIQKRIDRTYGIFTATVARNRDLDEKDVRATEAATFGAEEAIEIGLADSMAIFEDAYAAFAEELRDEEEGPTMSKENQAAATDTMSKAAYDAAVAAARTEGEKAGASAERTRITTILGSDAGKARPNAALAAALDTDMTADQAAAFLAKLPEEKAETDGAKGGEGAGVGAKLFEAAMNGSGNPEVGAGEGSEKAAESDDNRIFASFQAATGYKAKK